MQFSNARGEFIPWGCGAPAASSPDKLHRGPEAATRGKELNRKIEKVGKIRCDRFPIFPVFLFQTYRAKSSQRYAIRIDQQ